VIGYAFYATPNQKHLPTMKIFLHAFSYTLSLVLLIFFIIACAAQQTSFWVDVVCAVMILTVAHLLHSFVAKL